MSDIKTINDSNFETEIEQAQTLAVVDFGATWCGPCKKLDPIFKEIAEEFDDVVFGKADIDQTRQTAMKFGIMSVPTLVFIKEGELAKKIVGLTTKPEILKAIDKLK